jgi:hypothetical protein
MDELTVMLVAGLGGIVVAVAVVVNAATSSSLLCFGYAFFLLCFLFPFVNGVPASLQWLRGDVVGASGAVGGAEEEDRPW